MTWLDILLIVILVVFISVGARLGSLWTGACVLGGFLGSFLADVYSLPLSEIFGSMPGAGFVSVLLLFITGLLLMLIPGWILSKATSILFLGILDSAFGFLTGALTGVVAICLFLLLLVPMAPKMEKSRAWKKSAIVKPLHDGVEKLFNSPNLRPKSLKKKLSIKNMKKMSKASEKKFKKLKKQADNLVDDLTP